jgi:hypothetical protein
MGTYDSEPIVPNNYLSGTDQFAKVSGRNNTSILFEGEVDGNVPISISIGVEFTYSLLMYKSLEDNKIYIEGDFNVSGGLYFLSRSLFETTFLLTYSIDKSVDDFIYTTDVIGLNEWITIMTPTTNGIEIYSTNTDSIEYFTVQNEYLDILYSSNWYEEVVTYKYELYSNNQMVYSLINDNGSVKYHIPMSSFSNWDLIEFTEDSKWGDNEFSYKISKLGMSIKDGIIDETPLLTEPTWIISTDYKHYFNNLDELDKENASSTIIMQTNSKFDMQTFIGDTLAYTMTSNWDEYVTTHTSITGYQYMMFQESLGNFTEIFVKFNLRD